jgi:transposase
MYKTRPTPQHLKELKQKGYTQRDIAAVYGVSERMVRYWKKDNGKPKKPRGHEFKIDGDYAVAFLLQIQHGCLKNSTQQEMADYWFKQTGQEVSRYSVSRILKMCGITRKKTSYHYAERYRDRTEEFKKTLPALSQPLILALDECSFHLNEVPRYGYAFTKYRVNSLKPGIQGENHTLMLCIQNVKGKGVLHYELIQGGMKSKDFHNFLTNLKLPTEEKYYLIMDNLRTHKAKQSCIKLGLTPIKELLVSKNVQILFLPPYTPEMNPVELCFNFIRHYVEKNKPRNFEELKLAIDKIVDMLNEKDLTEYFRHCFNYKYDEELDNLHTDTVLKSGRELSTL